MKTRPSRATLLSLRCRLVRGNVGGRRLARRVLIGDVFVRLGAGHVAAGRLFDTRSTAVRRRIARREGVLDSLVDRVFGLVNQALQSRCVSSPAIDVPNAPTGSTVKPVHTGNNMQFEDFETKLAVLLRSAGPETVAERTDTTIAYWNGGAGGLRER